MIYLLRHKLQQDEVQRFTVVFDKDHGWGAWLGAREPDDPRWWSSQEDALLALLIDPLTGGDPGV